MLSLEYNCLSCCDLSVSQVDLNCTELELGKMASPKQLLVPLAAVDPKDGRPKRQG